MVSAKVVLDSVSPAGVRLTTMELKYHRFVHSEFMTHRMFSRNAASSRAIPVSKMLRAVWKDPAVPVWWGATQKGMQATTELSGWRLVLFQFFFLKLRYAALACAWLCLKLGGHKQLVNRILEPWSWITVVVTGTEDAWANFFWLRLHVDAQPEIQAAASAAYREYHLSRPTKLKAGQWHLPYIQPDEYQFALDDLVRISVARVARVSYLTHDGKRDINADLDLYKKLIQGSGTGAWHPGHWSPFEHVAKAMKSKKASGNFHGWEQYRKTFEAEFNSSMDIRFHRTLFPLVRQLA